MTDGNPSLSEALGRLRTRLGAVRLPLDLPGTPDARRECAGVVAQLDDYVLPRLREMDAPLLAVVGGSTGAGKSTLVNAVAGRVVSRPGVLRPTTRSPVLVHHPQDREAFEGTRILPALSRVAGSLRSEAPRDAGRPQGDGGRLVLVAEPAIPPGLAVLDAPDVDSVVAANRQLAEQLLAAADLWIFVTTAARYADAVPWGFLAEAARRSAAVAVVLDRVPPEAGDEVAADLRRLMGENGLGDAELFVVPETALDADGMLPDAMTADLRAWLRGLAGDAQARAAVVRRTLDGAVAALSARVPPVAHHADLQARTVRRLREVAEAAYRDAAEGVDEGMRDGSVLRGEVLARWQEFVGTGEFFRSLEARVGRIRDRLSAAIRGRPAPGAEVGEAIEHGVQALIVDAAERAAEETARRWRADPGGATLLAGVTPDPALPSPGLRPRVAEAVRAWQGDVLDLVREQAGGKRATARVLSFGVNGLGIALMIVAFASTGGITGVEAGIAGGTAVVGQRILEAVFGDQAVRELAARARADLRTRVDDVLGHERARFLSVADGAAIDPAAGDAIRDALRTVERVRGTG